MDLVVEVYSLTQRFPKEELYGLTNQIRRAAVSISPNIAEGQGWGIGGEFSRHLRIAIGSLQEVETHLLIAERLKYLSSEQVEPVYAAADEVGKLLRGLHASVSATASSN